MLGAGGFLGSHIVPGLRARFDCSIDAVDVDLTKLEHRDEHVRRIHGRVEDPALVGELLSRADVVLSLTALCNPALYSTIPLQVIDASFTHLLPLVARCAEKRVRLVHFSTAEVYGRRALDAEASPTRVMNEDDCSLVLGPVAEERWTYACAKQLLERVIFAHGQHGQLPFTIIRPFNTIGARMDFLPGIDGEGTPRVLCCFMNALLRGEPLELVDGGRQRRAFMAVEDMVEAVCRVIERPRQADGQIFNLGNPDNDISIEQLARRLAEAFSALRPRAPRARFQQVSAAAFYGPGYADTLERIPDIDKARRLLGWSPQQSLSEMLPSIVADYVARYADAVASQRPSTLTRLASSG